MREEKTLCITSDDKKSMIFKIVDYIHSYGKKRYDTNIRMTDEYVVCKFGVAEGFPIIIDAIEKQIGNALSIFMLVGNDGTTHTVSLFNSIINRNINTFIDVARGINQEYSPELIQKHYPNVKHMYCIFTVSKDKSRFVVSEEQDEMMIDYTPPDYRNEIIDENELPQIKIGGDSRKTKKNMKYISKKSKKKTKSHKK